MGTEVGNPAKVRLKGINREQTFLRSVDVEELVPTDHEVRAIWEFVGRLDLSKYYATIKVVEGEAGRPAYDPRLLISVWVYAYSCGESSAREISKLCEKEPAYQWLTGMESINHHSLSDFRVEHKAELDELFIQMLGVMSAEGLITLDRVMQDGTKVKANAGGDTFHREERIRKHLEMAREQVERMGDPREEGMSRRVAAARARGVREKKERLEKALTEMEKIRQTGRGKEKEEERASTTDPESRIMKHSDGAYAPSYNVQVSTDAADGIIVGVGVGQNASDYGEMDSAVARIEKTMGRRPKQMVADGGFTTRENIMGMSEKGIDFIGSVGDHTKQAVGQMKRRGVDPAFYPGAFRYDAALDHYTCPAGKVLRYETKYKDPGVTKYLYRARAEDCRGCAFKEKCCPQNAKGRSIQRSEDDAEVVAFKAKMATPEAKAIYRERGWKAEFSNLWIKAKMGLRQFRVRGQNNVAMEALWVCLACNIKHWIRLRWRPELMAT